ncbi:MAG: hypothetical protein NC489_37825 [Ruminococcus flavefaciens]|nr:hypothetical protein [Ruminococcus flavefaciens]
MGVINCKRLLNQNKYKRATAYPRQTDSYGTITARDNYELTRNISKCVGVERLHKDVNMQIPFNADEINLIYQFGEQSKAETYPPFFRR